MIRIYENSRLSIFLGFMLVLMVFMAGCASNLTMVAPMAPEKYEKLGYATGNASGALFSPLVGTAYYFIPIMLNDRVERAYANAISSVPGATGLINVTYQESWYWWVLGETRSVTISGEAIKEVK
jgi:hypothetical protein